jgi:ribulose kinase
MVSSMAWAMLCFYGLNYAIAYVYASMIHLRATIRGISFHATCTLIETDNTDPHCQCLDARPEPRSLSMVGLGGKDDVDVSRQV